MRQWLEDVELSGNAVKLIPMVASHKSALVKAASDGKLWELWYTNVPSEKTIGSYIDDALNEKGAGRSLPFMVLDKNTGGVIGATRYCNAQPQHRRLEIGFTWYAKSYQRTAVNTECKYLLMAHAFERLNCIAVEFRTHWHNHASRNAILRLGAKQDGILRNHQVDPDGTLRDTVVFSILNSEWKAVKKSLEFKLRQKP